MFSSINLLRSISLFFFCSLFCYSQNDNFQSFILDSKVNMPTENHKINIPILENIVELIVIEVKIDKKNYNFIIDTGAMISLISDEIVSENDEVFNNITITDGTGRDREAPTIKKNLLIGDAQFDRIGFAVIDFKHINKYSCLKIDGILGINAIRLCNWQIDPFSQNITLSNESISTSLNGLGIDLSYYSLLPLIEVAFGKENFYTLLDTGFNEALIINNDFFRKNKKSKKSPLISGNGLIGKYSSLSESNIKRTTIDSIYIGSQLILNQTVYISKEKPLLGYGFLKNYITTINFSEDKLYLNKPSFISEDKNYGFSLNLNQQNELVISFLWDNSTLKNGNINLGDKVLEINGIKTNGFVNNEFFCTIRENIKASKYLEITILRRNQEKSFIIQRK